ncbi:hypothetical protein [Pseudogulbenkiania ferrooxidans]|uniref:Uncharacterized protein n=1 Tax=Pseudogulbenkiania ferrooxidans 2002 TaxID=279714 RepID=B9YY50_9NEIS|nr:hypothetical protein [Pseudogulbenkiania ferrooxidans]EEG10053.1 hypothetical protein FuraDRAFT_0035 [Pseudogulbenkiania ferrooxidans 2002]
MFDKILIANRGDQLPPGGAATKSHRTVAVRDAGDLAAETRHVR